MVTTLSRVLTLGLACGLLAACSPGLQPAAVGPSTTASGKPVTFTVSLDAKAFSPKSPITVRIWDQAELQIQDETSKCTVSYDVQAGRETVSCPTGVVFRKSTPEEFQVTPAELTKGYTVTSKTVTVGERYRLSVGGRAADECNSAGATASGTATSEAITHAALDVMQTQMACAPAPK